MAEIKPSEISEIIKSELAGFNQKSTFGEVGVVLQVGDGIARIFGLNNVKSNELVEFESGVKGIVLNLEEDNVGAVLLGTTQGVEEGDKVKSLGEIASIEVGDGLLGRVVNTLGEPIDGKGPIAGQTIALPLERKAPGVLCHRLPVAQRQPLQMSTFG